MARVEMGRGLFLLIMLCLSGSALQAQSVRGRVLSNLTQKSVAGAQVQLDNARGEVIARSVTSATGAFVLTGAAGQRYRLRIAAIGSEEHPSIDIVVPADGMTITDIMLQPIPIELRALTAISDRGACPRAELSAPAYAKSQQQDRAHAAAVRPGDTAQIGEGTLPLTARWYRLWDPPSGRPISLMTFALPAVDTAGHPSQSRTAALTLSEWDRGMRQWSDTSLTVTFTIPDTIRSRKELVGSAIIPFSADLSLWSVTAIQYNRSAHISGGTTQDLHCGTLALSDIVTGPAVETLPARFHSSPLFGSPRPRREPDIAVLFYYQVRSNVRLDEDVARQVIRLFPIVNGVVGHSPSEEYPILDANAIPAGISEHPFPLEIWEAGGLPTTSGLYLLEIRVIGAHGKTMARQTAVVDLERRKQP